jgi:hypothetical protein
MGNALGAAGWMSGGKDSADAPFMATVLQAYGLVPPPISPCAPKVICGVDVDPNSAACTDAVDKCTDRNGGTERACDTKEVCGGGGVAAAEGSKECTKAMDTCMAKLVSQPRGLVKSDVQEFWFLKQNVAVLNETISDRVANKYNLAGAIIARIPRWLLFAVIAGAVVFGIIFIIPAILILIRMLGDATTRFKLIMMAVFGLTAVSAYFILIKIEIL